MPLGMKWACICAGNGCCVWWCLVVLVRGSMWWYVLFCRWRRCFGCCVVVTVRKIKNRTELRILPFKLVRKTIKSAPRTSVIIFAGMVHFSFLDVAFDGGSNMIWSPRCTCAKHSRTAYMKCHRFLKAIVSSDSNGIELVSS